MSSPQEIVRGLVDAGLTQAQIESRTGVPQATISRILTGKHINPRFDTVERLRQLRVAIGRKKAATKRAQGATL